MSEQQQQPFAAAITGSKLGALNPGERPSARAILAAMGGIRGLFESIVPGFLFLVLYTTTREVLWSVLVPLVLSIALVAIRVLTKGESVLAFAGLFGVGISAAIALFTGNAEDNFVWGFFVNGATVAVLTVSLLVRRPLVGVIAGALTHAPNAWRTQPAKRTVARRATVLLLVVIVARLAVQVPLYFAAQTDDSWVAVLAGTKLAMGLPLYAAALWIVWLMVRSVLDTPQSPKDASAQQPE